MELQTIYSFLIYQKFERLYSEQLKKLMDQYKNGIITGYEYAKEKKKILN